MFSLAFLTGVSLALQLSSLPAVYWLLLFIPILTCCYKYACSRIYFALPLGFLWVVVHGLWGLSSELPTSLVKKDVLITGTITSLPDANDFRIRFEFDVETLKYKGEFVKHFPRRIRLNWYDKSIDIKAGQTWQLKVRLKPAHGMLNPGGFDYEKWLFERGIRATGYIRKGGENTLLQKPTGFSPLHLRERLKNTIQAYLPESPYRALVLALAIGDRSEITDDQWKVLIATGTNHLVAISGLHIGLVAGGVYVIFLFLFKRSRHLLLTMPAHKVAALFALFAAFVYAMLAGFAIPTQRALVMTAVVMLGVLLNKRFSFSQILSFALIAVLLLDPFSVMSAGFWLSFIAVAAILYAMQGRLKPTGLWWKWGRMQWIITLALAPVLIFVFQSFSIISPLANIVAVPWVSLVTVPVLLIGLVLSFIEPVGQGLVFIANESLKWLWFVLDYMAAFRFSQWQQFAPQTWTLFPALIGVLLAIAPRGFPARYLAFVFLMPMFLVKPEKLPENEFQFHLLDVGQGLSAVIQTQNHVLVYDTGPKFRSGFNSGEAVVIPFLKSLAVNKLDMLIISHGDNDHIGGMESILDNISVDKIISGAIKKTPQPQAEACVGDTQWHWDGVMFEIIHPSDTAFIGKGNNGSCVLRVSVGDQAILLTGDIEKAAEKYLVEHKRDSIQAEVLIAAHHGSNTSSTREFIEAVNPDWVLFPAGYVNRFQFPKAEVLKRYSNAEVKGLITGDEGAISLTMNTSGQYTLESYRQKNKRFWQ